MDKKLKVLLLAAGLGTRLKPITNNIPKCLVRINNKPLLHIWLEKLENLNCDSILINTHYLPDKVNKAIYEWNGEKSKIYTTFEKNLLGTAGTLMKNIDFFNDSEGLIIHADNITNDNLIEFVNAHKNRPTNTILTMLTFETDNPKACGVVKINKENVVQEFYEKVNNPPSKLANGAIYAFGQDFISYLKNMDNKVFDISKDIIPSINGRIFSYKTNANFLDIGTPTNLKKAQKLFNKGLK